MTRTSHHRRFGARGNRRGGGARVASAAPPTISIAGTVTIGGTLTATHDGDTVQWYRDGVAISGQTADTYTPVAADIDDTVDVTCRATGAGGTTESNALAFAPDTRFPSSAIGVSTSGLTLADTNTTVDQWAAAYGGKKAAVTLSAPAATNRPAYSATGGPGSRPLVTFDGVDNVLRSTAVTMGTTIGGFDQTVVGKLYVGEGAGDRIMIYGSAFALATNATPVARCFTTGGAGTIISTGTTTFTTTHRQASFDWDGTNQTVRVNESTEDTDAAAQAAYADGQSLSLGANSAGTNPSQLDVIGWAFTAVASGAPLTASQRADLRAFFQNKTGVA